MPNLLLREIRATKRKSAMSVGWPVPATQRVEQSTGTRQQWADHAIESSVCSCPFYAGGRGVGWRVWPCRHPSSCDEVPASLRALTRW